MTRVEMTHTGSGLFTGTRPDGLSVYVNTLTNGNRGIGIWEVSDHGTFIYGSGTLKPDGDVWVGECEMGRKQRYTVRWDGRVVEFGE